MVFPSFMQEWKVPQGILQGFNKAVCGLKPMKNELTLQHLLNILMCQFHKLQQHQEGIKAAANQCGKQIYMGNHEVI